MTDPDRYQVLLNEIQFRHRVIRRVWPTASFRVSRGGFFWDRHQPTVAHMILGTESHQVVFDLELTLLHQAIDACLGVRYRPDADGGAVVARSNRAIDTLVACACDDDTWHREDVQRLHEIMFNPEPLTEKMAEAGIEALGRQIDAGDLITFDSLAPLGEEETPGSGA